MNKKKPFFFVVLFFSCLVFSLWGISVGWDRNILDVFGFRQAQTAISSYYFLQGSPFFAYHTPVMGPPWSIPFEFPFYQWIVALVSKGFEYPLDQSGRLVSAIFFYLTLIPAWSVLKDLEIKREHRFVFLSLFL